MSAAPDISQLKEIALPEPVSYLPQTWGWLLVLAVFVVAVLAFSAWRYWHWRNDRYRRDALLLLGKLEQAFATNPQALRELPELLKRVALSMPDAPSVGSLSGEPWQAFLQNSCREQLPADFARHLAELAYAPPATLQTLASERGEALLAQARRWVEGHHVAA